MNFRIATSVFFGIILLSQGIVAGNLAYGQSPDFGLQRSQETIQMNQNHFDSGQMQLTVSPQNGFDGTIDLTITVDPPNSGVTASIDGKTKLSVSLNSKQSLDVDIGVADDAETKEYKVTITGTSNINGQKVTRITFFTIKVVPPEEFSIKASPIEITIPQGGSATTFVTATVSEPLSKLESIDLELLTPITGEFTSKFSGDGELAPEIYSGAWILWLVHPTPDYPTNSQLTVSASAQTPPGTYNANIVGKLINSDFDEVKRHTVPLIIQVTVPDNTTKEKPHTELPEWFKSNAKWWNEGLISDDEIINAIESLMNQGVIKIDQTSTKPQQTSEQKTIPRYVKDVFGFWSDDAVSDSEVSNSIGFLISQGIISSPKLQEKLDSETFGPEPLSQGLSGNELKQLYSANKWLELSAELFRDVKNDQYENAEEQLDELWQIYAESKTTTDLKKAQEIEQRKKDIQEVIEHVLGIEIKVKKNLQTIEDKAKQKGLSKYELEQSTKDVEQKRQETENQDSKTKQKEAKKAINKAEDNSKKFSKPIDSVIDDLQQNPPLNKEETSNAIFVKTKGGIVHSRDCDSGKTVILAHWMILDKKYNHAPQYLRPYIYVYVDGKYQYPPESGSFATPRGDLYMFARVLDLPTDKASVVEMKINSIRGAPEYKEPETVTIKIPPCENKIDSVADDLQPIVVLAGGGIKNVEPDTAETIKDTKDSIKQLKDIQEEPISSDPRDIQTDEPQEQPISSQDPRDDQTADETNEEPISSDERQDSQTEEPAEQPISSQDPPTSGTESESEPTQTQPDTSKPITTTDSWYYFEQTSCNPWQNSLTYFFQFEYSDGSGGVPNLEVISSGDGAAGEFSTMSSTDQDGLFSHTLTNIPVGQYNMYLPTPVDGTIDYQYNTSHVISAEVYPCDASTVGDGGTTSQTQDNPESTPSGQCSESVSAGMVTEQWGYYESFDDYYMIHWGWQFDSSGVRIDYHTDGPTEGDNVDFWDYTDSEGKLGDIWTVTYPGTYTYEITAIDSQNYCGGADKITVTIP